ncbi:myo-inosose-2 dehydratase [Commensalibacter oyaizuii]|uniref:Myo-inosose-2 dehydratase n=1 Tax=Commensalibacter oyaizuii TaxID=3043873 RepID=A0ABT6Q2M6_9PROT|nr:myo-inosose-2 dehydratase [Commensalibacter sp. TBRC 16381]MDI2091378.1 myo-inosose-2 dehydratase [Commensalibacter sp. TBRC 16381]
MAIRIGAHAICWSNDDMPELGGDIPLDTCLSEASQIGLEGMEMGNKFPKEANALKTTLGKYNLDLTSWWFSGALLLRSAKEEFAAMRSQLDLLKAMNCDCVVYAETANTIQGRLDIGLAHRPIMPLSEWSEYFRKLNELGKLTQDYGIKLAFHHHMGTIIQSHTDIDRLMTATQDNIYLLLDTGHAVWGGADPIKLANDYASRVAHIHTKDVRENVLAQANKENWPFLKGVLQGVFTVPGDGSVDYVKFFKPFQNYSGWIVIEAEQDPQKANPLQYVTKGYNHLIASLNSAGLKR